MQSFPPDIKFKLPWRTYQSRILKELEGLLTDNHLHVVAAPGSGKTILGLEVVLRLNNPTLILSPTLAIRDQWVERFIEHFLNDGRVNWISKDIKNPNFLTISTYQGLHSAMRGHIKELDEIENQSIYEKPQMSKKKHMKKSDIIKNEVILLLKKIGIKTIVVDEAHHLRMQWWRSLSNCINQLDDPVILALTATPPFDVSESEWKRYRELCGPVDTEVSVPELVLEKNLCPHQDYIMFSTPSSSEKQKIVDFRNSVHEFTKKLYDNHAFVEFLLNYPWLIDSENYIEDILSNPSFFSSIIVFLNHIEVKIPRSITKILLASSKEAIPIFDYEWLEILLTGLIFQNIENDDELPLIIDEIKRDLVQIGALERKTINLRNIKEIERILRSSVSKLNSINKIVDLEYSTLGNNLRMVVLTDYIRKEYLPNSENDLTPLTKIGVIPIFENLRRNLPRGLKLGVLSGSIVIVPTESEEMLQLSIINCDINPTEVKITKLSYTHAYEIIDIKGVNKEKIVQVLTEFFSNGGINVLVGTIALLGEGWDAPSINCLILASTVGSYMLSNQMRGRAIRTDATNPQKTANVWHLVCIETNLPPEEIYGNEDLNTILRRFKAFVAPSFKEPIIENGISRLNIGDPPFTETRISSLNEMMSKRAKNREKMSEEWEAALKRGEDGIKLIENIKLTKEHLPRSLIFKHTIQSILWGSLLIFLFGFFLTLYTFRETLYNSFFNSIENFIFIVLIILFLAVLGGMPKFLKAIWLFIRHGSIQSSMRQICNSILKTLFLIGIIKTDYKKITVEIEKDKFGTLYCHLEGATNREKVIFLEALKEILDPIKNPRYLLVRRSLFLNRFGRIDYHAVPTVIGVNKRYARLFAEIWEKYMGKMNLIYTRTRAGRKILLYARNHSLSASFRTPIERISRWN